MNKEEIEELLSVSETNCVSIIIPTHRLPMGKSEDPLILNKAIAKVKDVFNYKKISPDLLVAKLDKLHEQINFSHTKDGLGIFVSPRVSKLVHFPFPVIEKISVGNSFDSRALLYYKNILDYFVLSVTKKAIRLFSAKGEELEEIVNEDFPRYYDETYEYAISTIASSDSYSSKGFEKDKSVLQEIRLKAFLGSADHLLGKYIGNNVSLILSGGTKEVSDYKQITKHQQKIIGNVMGTYEYNKKEVIAAAWKFVQEYNKRKEDFLLAELKELIGKNRVAFGIEDIWNAAKEGKGMMLLIEKDLECHNLSLIAKTADDFPGSDMIDKIIKTVIEKKGKVTFMDKNMLKDFKGIALILRYDDSMS